MITIDDWSIVDDNDPWIAPELKYARLSGVVTGHPRKADGTRVITSPIILSYGKHVATRSGNIYELAKPSDEYLEFLYESGYNFDEEWPVKLGATK